MKRSVTAAWLLVVAIGCRTAAESPQPAAPAPAPIESAAGARSATPAPAAAQAATPARAMPDGLHWMRNSAEYRAALLQAYAAAAGAVDGLSEGHVPGSWAVILDADETVLNNSQYTKERTAQGLGYTPGSWTEWVKRRAATPLPGAVAFLRHVRARGGRVAIVTNRNLAECPDTQANFEAAGIPLDVMLCGSGDKNARFEQVARGAEGLPPLEVVMWVGDNMRDFPSLGQDLRTQPDSAFAAFGTRYFVIPNPSYGSWESNPRE